MNKQTQERATRRAKSRRKKIERNSTIYDAYTRAGSLRLVAAEFGVTHETVRQAVLCEKRRRMKEDKPVENVSKTSDRVDVVRCKDCVHWGKPFDTFCGEAVAYCEMFSERDAFRERFYCEHGERKEGA